MARTRASRNGPVTVTRLADPQAWQDALRRADGDHRRLKVIDYHTVVVANQPERDGGRVTPGTQKNASRQPR